ncbi:DUF1194 domain-containing protein [Aureimonas jatrophae]|jgi:hypothetical protein|uniref:VWFA domain-containing protein n=1 Tax=Aureimonas jatrophae TaxID=1166073 RepID=A0A1H0GD00_9HYPH|nr:DUF1194 domain-containing protein [Aureimonas jatrophae]MBB3949511.1 hypothetical protein [Aureimonas jatrophae]SDO04649.1 Protein of unknown function [Aureimonas jatrophae]
MRMLIAALALSSISAFAAQAADTPVDVELVLAVDVSWSMDRGEQEIQRAGYVAALRSPEVQKAILEGGYGRIAVAYVEWAGDSAQNVVVPWTMIDSKEAAEAFAYRLSVEEPDRERRTSISAAIDFVVPMFDDNGFEGMRRVIDISGDGPNNQGRPVLAARSAALERGITINGLPLMTSGEGDPMGRWGSIANLDRYYADCVIGGPGAFVIPVNEWSQFPEAVRRKLVLELADVWPTRESPEASPVLRIAASNASDCLVGEAMWQRRYDR